MPYYASAQFRLCRVGHTRACPHALCTCANWPVWVGSVARQVECATLALPPTPLSDPTQRTGRCFEIHLAHNVMLEHMTSCCGRVLYLGSSGARSTPSKLDSSNGPAHFSLPIMAFEWFNFWGYLLRLFRLNFNIISLVHSGAFISSSFHNMIQLIGLLYKLRPLTIGLPKK